MAKRGYRGKHPHNDMKVSNPSANKYSDKLADEYRKIKSDKGKYDYIRTHYFNPQSTCTLTIPATGVPTEGTNLVITSTNGTQVTYVASSSLLTREFNPADPSGSLATHINSSSGHGGKIIATSTPGQVLLEQVEPGPDGNRAVSGSTNLISASGQSGIVSTNGSFFF